MAEGGLYLPWSSLAPLRSGPMLLLLVFRSPLRSWGSAARGRGRPRGNLQMTSLRFGFGRGILCSLRSPEVRARYVRCCNTF